MHHQIAIDKFKFTNNVDNNALFISFNILYVLSLWKYYILWLELPIKLFGLGGTVKPGEE